MLNLPLLKQRGLRLLSKRRSFKDLCDKQWILCPGASALSQSAIYLDGALDKVTGAQPETTLAYEIQQVLGGPKEHAPTTAFQLRNACLVGGYVYKDNLKLPLTLAKESILHQDEPEFISEAALACTLASNRYFGHWMTDGLTLTLAAQQLATAVTTVETPTPHQVDYSNLFNIHPVAVTNAQFKTLTIIEDFGQNLFKRERYEYLRSQLKCQDSKSANSGVMLLRGNSGAHRNLVNEMALADFLRRQGFVILNPQTSSVQEIVQQTLGARIVVGVEGSQLVHGLFTLGAGGTILTLQPPYRFNSVYKDYTDCLALHYAFVVGRSVENGFEISLDDLARTLEKIDATVGQSSFSF